MCVSTRTYSYCHICRPVLVRALWVAATTAVRHVCTCTSTCTCTSDAWSLCHVHTQRYALKHSLIGTCGCSCAAPTCTGICSDYCMWHLLDIMCTFDVHVHVDVAVSASIIHLFIAIVVIIDVIIPLMKCLSILCVNTKLQNDNTHASHLNHQLCA